jgi:ferredoxin
MALMEGYGEYVIGRAAAGMLPEAERLREAIDRRLVPPDTPDRVLELHRQFHRIRWQVASALLAGDSGPDPVSQWEALAEKPIPSASDAPIDLAALPQLSAFRRASVRYQAVPTWVNACLTCRECSNACPVCIDPSAFDPVVLLRLAVLGLRDRVLRSPSLWLCIQCQTCTRTCAEQVRGHLVIRRLQEMAVAEGVVDVRFPLQWQEAERRAYGTLVDRVDTLLQENA